MRVTGYPLHPQSFRLGVNNLQVTVYIQCKQFVKFVPRIGHFSAGGINSYFAS